MEWIWYTYAKHKNIDLKRGWILKGLSSLFFSD